MSLPSFSVRRPVFTAMVSVIVVLIGLVSLTRIQVDLLPEIELPTLTVRTEYPGASPEVVEQAVTQMVEEIVATVPGVEELTSESSEGSSRVRVRFGWGMDIDTAALEVLSRLEDELDELPDEVLRPQVRKFDPNSFPIVILGVSSDLDPVELTALVNNQLRYRFNRIPNVAQVDMWGDYKREIRVELLPDRLMAFGLPLDLVLTAIGNSNLDAPAGKLESGRYELTLRAPAELQTLDDIRDVVITMREGAPVTLGQVARINDTWEKVSRIVRVNGKRGLRLAIRKESSANTVEVSEAVLAEVERINEAYPQLIMVPVQNQGNFIERSIDNVAKSVLYGGVLAILVLLFFLLNVRSTMVIALAIPISIISTLAVMYFTGITINLMSLGGLALGVGMMVDSSIVVLENIFRRRDAVGEDAATASTHGANEVATAIVASTITTLVVFLPLAFVRGASGMLFADLGYVIIASLLCSLVVSLTLLPMIASKLLQAEEREPPSWARALYHAAKGTTDRIDGLYLQTLNVALRHRWKTVGLAAGMLAASLFIVPFLGSEFLPPSDEGEVRIDGQMEVGQRLAIVEKQTRLLEALLVDEIEGAQASVTTVGVGWRGGAPRGGIELSLGPAAERSESNTEIAARIRRKITGQVPGMRMRVRAPQGSFVLQRLLGGEDDLVVELRGYDFAVLDRLAAQVKEVMADIEGITDVEESRLTGIPQRELTINREKVADLGLSVKDVSDALQTAVAGSKAGEYRVEGNSHRILVQLADIENVSFDDVMNLTLTTADGQQVALRNLVRETDGSGPLSIERKDQQRISTVAANIAGRDMGSIAEELEERVQGIARPAGYDIEVTGTYEEQRKSSRELTLSMLLAILLVYMVLASQYESFTSPLVVMLSVPVAAVGVFVVLLLTNTTLNVQTYIGIIMLGGIVVNNAILLVDQTEQLIRDGMSVNDAVTEAGRRRLRPILMTTLTTMLGLLPLALGIGEGADAQAPLARAVIGGLLGSTPLTLVLIPAVYSLTHRDRSTASALTPAAATN